MIRNHMSIPTEQGGACPVDYRGCIEAYILSRGILSQCQKFFMVETLDPQATNPTWSRPIH